MFTAFFIGNIASGKSFATRHLEGRGAERIDLDDLCKELYVPGSALLGQVADAFGADVLDEEGNLVRPRLAERAFASAETAATLDGIVYPALMDELGRILLPSPCFPARVAGCEPVLRIVEVSNAAAFCEAFGLADEVVAVCCPLGLRRERALGRGMAPEDFDRRAGVQPTDDAIERMADVCLRNDGDPDAFLSLLDEWALGHGLSEPDAARLEVE